MQKTRLSVIIVIFILIFSSFSFTALADEQQEINDKPLIDFFRGFKVEFEPPELIQDCGSYFFLKVNLTKYRILPVFFSISVFLRFKDKFGKSRVIVIGQDPNVYIPPFHRKTVTISIPCFTKNNLLSNLKVRYREINELQIKKASIGVKINNVRLYRTFISSLRQSLNSFLINLNPFIVWKELNITSPHVCFNKNDIKFQCDIDDETDDKANFNVTAVITNNLDEDISAVILVDMADAPIINALFPTFRETMYCLGFFEEIIRANSCTKKTIKCSFPKGSFYNKNYYITVECAPYISNGNINKLFGFCFFDLRWKTGIKPFYVVNGSVQSSIQNLWYNLPLYCGDPESQGIFPTVREPILYKGEEPTLSTVEEITKQVGKEVKSWIILFFFCVLLLIGIACLGYWIVRKKS